MENVFLVLMLKVLNLSNDKTFTYQIVGEDEADVKIGKISFASPLSRGFNR